MPQSKNDTSLGEFLGLLISLPFAWLEEIDRLPPGEQALTKVCNGAGMLALLVLWYTRLGGGFEHAVFSLVADPENLLNWIPPALAVWALTWIFINARFAVQAIGRPQRASMIGRALLKIGAGFAAWSYAAHAPQLF